jgi:hypothetical protein
MSMPFPMQASHWNLQQTQRLINSTGYDNIENIGMDFAELGYKHT